MQADELIDDQTHLNTRAILWEMMRFEIYDFSSTPH